MRRLYAGLLVAGMLAGPAAAQLYGAPEPPARFAEGGGPAERLVRAVVRSGDHGGRPFIVVDKARATVTVFSPDGAVIERTPALLGSARGDRSEPWQGERELSDIRPEERTTPAGRFEAGLGGNLAGRTVLWVDYDSAVSLHPVINTDPKERRPHRLTTPTPADNRISHGCINVPAPFFQEVVRPAFADGGVVYILPEEAPAAAVFPRLLRR